MDFAGAVCLLLIENLCIIDRIYVARKARREEGAVMVTASITKRFVIKDDKACERLINELNNPNRKVKKISNHNAYEEGKKLFKQYLSLKKGFGN